MERRSSRSPSRSRIPAPSASPTNRKALSRVRTPGRHGVRKSLVAPGASGSSAETKAPSDATMTTTTTTTTPPPMLPDITVGVSKEAAVETVCGTSTVPAITLNDESSSRASSASPVPSITVSIPDSPEETQPPPPLRTSSMSSSIRGGGLHPRRARSLSAGSSSSSSARQKAVGHGQGVAVDMRAMAARCAVPEHGKAVNTVRDLKSEIEELNERVEQGEKQADELAALARKERDGRARLEESQAEAQRLRTQVDEVGMERDELLRAKRSAVRELDRLKRERGREKRACSVAEHNTLHQRLRAMEREREEAARARTCSMPVHHEFLKTYADQVNKMDREILALTAEKEKLLAREVCTLPLHKIVLQEYKDQVIKMDLEIQAKDGLLEEKDEVIAAAKSCEQEDNAEIKGEDAEGQQQTRAAELKATENRLDNQKAKFRKDVQSAIAELERQERETDSWIAQIARRDVYAREITDEDLESLHKMYMDRTNCFRALKKAMLSDDGSSQQRQEQRSVERRGEEQERRLRSWLKKRDDVVRNASTVIERLQTALRERDTEMIALKKGAKISIDRSKRDPDHFDLRWELDQKYHALEHFATRAKVLDHREALKRLEEQLGEEMKGDGGAVRLA